MINCHFHDEHSSDGSGTVAEYCEAAMRAGVGELCVTNHVEVLTRDGGWIVDPTEALGRFGRVREAIEEARGRWPSLRLWLGAEFEFRPEWTDALASIDRVAGFDFVIGSLHVVDGRNISGGSDVDAFFEGLDQATAYGRYFESLLAMVEWGAFDVVGHFDLIKRYGHARYGPYDPADHADAIREILGRMAASGIGIEINTSGVFQAPGTPYPEREILVWARELGVPALTLGTDAHSPDRLDQGLAEGYELAREAGWDSVCVFERRVPRRHPLPDAAGRTAS